MDKKKIIIIAVGVVAISLLLVVVFSVIQKQRKGLDANIASNNYVPVNEIADESGDKINPEDNFKETEFVKEVPTGVKVPKPGEIIPDELKDIVAVPTEVLGPRDGSEDGASIGIFNIKGEGGKFIPSQIIINQNDIVKIKISAIDADYDFVLQGYNMKQTIKMGETKSLSFQALKNGRFLFYCDVCGGIQSDATGEIVIVKQE